MIWTILFVQLKYNNIIEQFLNIKVNLNIKTVLCDLLKKILI